MSLTRRESREAAFFAVFESAVTETASDVVFALADESELFQYDEYSVRLTNTVAEHMAEIDAMISDKLVDWTIPRLPKTALAILRISCAEILFIDEVPDNIAINEAVELAKLYCADDDYQFVNGVLGSIQREKAKNE